MPVGLRPGLDSGAVLHGSHHGTPRSSSLRPSLRRGDDSGDSSPGRRSPLIQAAAQQRDLDARHLKSLLMRISAAIELLNLLLLTHIPRQPQPSMPKPPHLRIQLCFGPRGMGVRSLAQRPYPLRASDRMGTASDTSVSSLSFPYGSAAFATVIQDITRLVAPRAVLTSVGSSVALPCPHLGKVCAPSRVATSSSSATITPLACDDGDGAALQPEDGRCECSRLRGQCWRDCAVQFIFYDDTNSPVDADDDCVGEKESVSCVQAPLCGDSRPSGVALGGRVGRAEARAGERYCDALPPATAGLRDDPGALRSAGGGSAVDAGTCAAGDSNALGDSRRAFGGRGDRPLGFCEASSPLSKMKCQGRREGISHTDSVASNAPLCDSEFPFGRLGCVRLISSTYHSERCESVRVVRGGCVVRARVWEGCGRRVGDGSAEELFDSPQQGHCSVPEDVAFGHALRGVRCKANADAVIRDRVLLKSPLREGDVVATTPLSIGSIKPHPTVVPQSEYVCMKVIVVGGVLNVAQLAERGVCSGVVVDTLSCLPPLSVAVVQTHDRSTTCETSLGGLLAKTVCDIARSVSPSLAGEGARAWDGGCCGRGCAACSDVTYEVFGGVPRKRLYMVPQPAPSLEGHLSGWDEIAKRRAVVWVEMVSGREAAMCGASCSPLRRRR